MGRIPVNLDKFFFLLFPAQVRCDKCYRPETLGGIKGILYNLENLEKSSRYNSSWLVSMTTAQSLVLFCNSLMNHYKNIQFSNGFMQVSISSITIPPGHDLRGTKTLPSGQSFCTKTLHSGQYRESKAPPPGHKVRKFHNVSINSDTI